MQILIADDDRVTRRMLEAILAEWGFETILVDNGLTALEALQSDDPPPLAILDWVMPALDGLEVCRRVRENEGRPPIFLILLTVKGSQQDIVAGLQGGADDYITKPFDLEELRARIQTGRRIVDLQRRLADQVAQLEGVLGRVKQLQGLLPICSYCKNVRDDQNYWQQVDDYLTAHSEVRFTHGICPNCWKAKVDPELRQLIAAQGDAAREER